MVCCYFCICDLKCVMKEFLVNHDNKWVLWLLDSDVEENSYRVAVPSGADVARYCEGFIEFYKNDFNMFFSSRNKIWDFSISNKSILSQNIVWQRSEDFTKVTNDELKHRVNDKVNNPSHYSDSTIECIDAMEAMMTPEQFIGYLRGNVAKYLWRYDKKNGIEDLQKSEWYLKKLIEKEIKNEDQGGDCVSIDW